jgi:hypothetical protein
VGSRRLTAWAMAQPRETLDSKASVLERMEGYAIVQNKLRNSKHICVGGTNILWGGAWRSHCVRAIHRSLGEAFAVLEHSWKRHEFLIWALQVKCFHTGDTKRLCCSLCRLPFSEVLVNLRQLFTGCSLHTETKNCFWSPRQQLFIF